MLWAFLIYACLLKTSTPSDFRWYILIILVAIRLDRFQLWNRTVAAIAAN